VKGSGGTVRAETRFAALRRFQGASSASKEIFFLEFGVQATLNGRPLLTRDHVRKAAAVYFGRAMESGYTTNAEVLEALLDVARRIGDPLLIESITSGVESLRAREGLNVRGTISKRATERLAEWLQLQPGAIHDGSQSTPAASS
jgi:hypothetical protein